MQIYTAHRLSSPNNLLFPDRMEIDIKSVTYYKGNIIGYQSNFIERKKIASVYIDSKIFFADLVIETIGGKRVMASGFLKDDARTIVRLLNLQERTKTTGINQPDYYSRYDINSFQNIANLQNSITRFALDLNLLNAAIFWHTIIERIKYNLKPFQFHLKLSHTANLHSEQMKTYNFFNHENDFNKIYETLKERIDYFKDSAFQGFKSFAENIADYPNIKANEKFTIKNINGKQRLFASNSKEVFPLSYREYAKVVVEGWMNSLGHKENILNPDFEYLGCGCATYLKSSSSYSMLYFKLTQNFGRSVINSSLIH